MSALERSVDSGADVLTYPTVSVIVPAYNAARFIVEALESVFAQTRNDFEVIVVNDGSPDTPELETVLASFRSRIVYVRQENRGVSGARNSGIRISRGRFLAFLDPDDIWERDYLEIQLGIVEKDENIGVLYPNALVFGDGPWVGRKYMDVCPSNGDVTFESLVTQNCNVMISCVARREAITAVGMFDEALRSSEDFELWLRVVKAGHQIVYHRRPLVRYRRHASSQSANALWMYNHSLKALEKARLNFVLASGELKAVEKKIAEFGALKALTEGKQALHRGDLREAIEKLDRANGILRRKKVDLALMMLRLSPQTLVRLVGIRRRFLALKPELVRKQYDAIGR